MEGKTSREIGAGISLSKHTVDTYRRKIIRKFGVKKTFDLTKLVQK